MAALLLFSTSAAYAQSSDAEQEYKPTIESPAEDTSPSEFSTIVISPSESSTSEISPLVATAVASDTLSATYNFTDYTRSKGEFKSLNSINWSGSNKTVTITLKQYEKIAVPGSANPGHTDASIEYDLESQNGNRCGSKTITGLYDSKTATVTWTNVKPGTYNVIFKIVGTNYTDGSGTFTAS